MAKFIPIMDDRQKCQKCRKGVLGAFKEMKYVALFAAGVLN